MCGRYTLRTPLSVLAEQFLFDLGPLPPDVLAKPRFNIAPTQEIAAVRKQSSSSQRELALFHWGLIPSWAKDMKLAASMINARSETIAEKPAFRSALSKRRCLILSDGFYEWKKEGKQKLPYYFQLANGRPFAFAGLWERWRGGPSVTADSANAPIESATIITTAANELCQPFHERMPVILHPNDYDLWLNPEVTDSRELLPLLAPLPAEEMQTRPVNPRVNNVRNDDAGVLDCEPQLF
jgi:putative SOS response-associated peptidase YedK